MFKRFLSIIDGHLRATKPSETAAKATPHLEAEKALDVLALEDRILYSAVPIAESPDAPVEIESDSADIDSVFVAPNEPDAAPNESDLDAGTADDLNANQDLVWTGQPDDASAISNELIFIDTAVEDFEQLIEDIESLSADSRSIEIIFIDPTRDGIEQISDALSTRSDIDAIHIVSHGTEGQVQLGNTFLNNQSISAYSGQIAGWSSALDADADLLLYGCDLASDEGESLIESIAALCDCDVAASDDITGHVSLGGDWDLEFVVGQVETDLAFSHTLQANYFNTFAPTDLVTTVSNTDGSLSINNDGGNDIYLLANNGGALVANQNSLTYEVQFASLDPGGSTPFLSYQVASNGPTANELLFFIEGSGALNLNINEQQALSNTMDYRTLLDGNRHSLAFTWDTSGGVWTFYVDGQQTDSGSNLASGATLEAGGTLVLGQEQDALAGGFTTSQTFGGTFYDARIWNTLRTPAQIAANYNSDITPQSGLFANWRFDDISTSDVVTDTVSGNNLTLNHTSEAGFTSSQETLNLNAEDNAPNGTAVGVVTATGNSAIQSLLDADNNLRYNSTTHKFYRLFNAGTYSWSTALADAMNAAIPENVLNGVTGELATIETASDQAIATELASSFNTEFHIAASDSNIEGQWHWYRGGSIDPSSQFWLGDANGTPVGGNYNNFRAGEPNDNGGDEDFLIVATDGSWNDAGPAANLNYLTQWDATAVVGPPNSGPFTYAITSQTINGAFTIDSNTGQITVADNNQLNFQTNPTHVVTVRSSDGNGTYDENVTINLRPGPTAPVISGGPDTAFLNESTVGGLTANGQLTVFDVNQNDNVTAAVNSVSVGGSGAGSLPGGLNNATLQSFLTVNPTAILDNSETTDTLNWNFNSGSEGFEFLSQGQTLVLTYTVSATDNSPGSLSDTETVTITITGTNAAPTITPIITSGSVTEDAPIGSGSINFADADGDLINSSIALSNITTNGPTVPGGLATALNTAMSLNQSGTSSGSITWDFSLNNSLTQYLGNGQSVTATYTITVNDNSGTANNTSTQNVTVVINGSNDTPIITVNDVTGNVTEDASSPTLSDAGSVNFTDADTNNSLSSSATLIGTSTTGPAIQSGLLSALNSALSLNQSGTNTGTINWTFNLANSQTQYLSTGETVTATYRITLSDNSGTGNSTTTQNVTVTINGNNDTVVITPVDVNGSVSEDTNFPNLTDSGSINFSGVDASNNISTSVVLINSSTTGPAVPGGLATALNNAMSLNQSGTASGTINWNFSVANNQTQYLANGESVTATYRVTVTDSRVPQTNLIQDITVVISGNNDRPTISLGDATGNVTEDASTPNLTDSGNINFSDSDTTDFLTSSAALTNTTTTGPSIPAALSNALSNALSINQTGNNNGTITWNFSVANSAVQYLANGETVTATYTITVSDDSGTGTSNRTQNVTVFITGTNDSPTITTGDFNGTVTENDSSPNLTDSGNLNWNEIDSTDIINSSVTLTSTTFNGPGISGGLASALTNAMSLNQTGSNDGTVTWNFSIPNSQTDYLGLGDSVTATYTITVADDSGTGNRTATQNIVVVINGLHNAPTVTVIDVTGNTSEDAANPTLTNSGSVTYEADVPGHTITSSIGTPTITTTGPAVPAGLSAALNTAMSLSQFGTNSGSIIWNFAVANDQTQYLANGETVTATYTLTVADNSGNPDNTTTQDITIVITGTNDTPTIQTVDVFGAVTEDAATPNLTDGGSITFAETDSSDILGSAALFSSFTTTGPTVPTATITALNNALNLNQTGSNDGTINWNFSVANSAVQYLANGETLTAVYTITVTDDSGTGNRSSTQNVTVVITGTNDAPIVTSGTMTANITEDAATPNLTNSAAINFDGIDSTDIISSSVTMATTSTTGPPIPAGLTTALTNAVSLVQSGTSAGAITWNFSVANNLVQYLGAGETITATYTITIVDDSGLANNTVTQDVTVVITGTNDTPTITINDVTGAVTEDGATPNLTDSGSINFAEVDNTDVINSSVVLASTTTTGASVPPSLTAGLSAAMNVNQTGTNSGVITWNFSLANSLTQFLAAGETVTATYTISVVDDSSTGSNTATQDVTVVITGTNDTPTITIVDVAGAVTEDAATPNLTDSGSVNFAETDDTDVLNSSVAMISTTTTGPAIPTTASTALANAMTLSQTGTNDGTVTWNFSLANNAAQYLADGETITATYTITLVDDSGLGNNTTTQNVTVVITGTNDTPSINVIDVTGNVTEDASTPNLTDNGNFTFTEIDDTDLLTSSVALTNTTTNGPAIPAALSTALSTALGTTQTGNNDGAVTWNFNLANNLIQYLAEGETVTATYTVTLTDDSGTGNDTETQDITVVIAGTNDTPTVTVVDVTGAVTEDASTPNLTDSGSVNFAEVDDTDILTSSVALSNTATTGPAIPAAINTALGTAMSLTQTGTNDGSITWNFNLANSLTQYLAQGEILTATYTITVTDDSGTGTSSTTQDVTVVITGTNDTPIITVVDAIGAVSENDSVPNLTDTGSLNFTGVDDTDNLSSSVAIATTSTTGPAIPPGLASALTTAMSLNQTGNNDGTITWNFSVANSETQYLAIGETVTATYTVTVVDDSGMGNNTATQDVTVVITGTNAAPIITVVDVTGAVTEDAATPNLTDSGSINFAEAEVTDNVTSSVALTNTATTGPAVPAALSTALGSAMGLTQTGTNSGSVDWSFSLDNSLTQYLADGETVTATYTITLVDDSGTANDTSTQDVTVVITGTNDTPTITVVDVMGAVTEDAATPNLTDNGSITFAEADDTDVLNSSVALTNTTTTGPAIPATASTALANAMTLSQTGTNDGTVTWNFSLANNAAQYLADGETITATYTITLVDDSGLGNNTTTQNVTVVITGTNDTPSINVIDVTGNVTEDASTPNLTDNGNFTFTEIDDTDLLTSSVALTNTTTTGPAIPAALSTALSTALGTTQTGNNDGAVTWNFNLANNLIQYLAEGETVTATYTVTLTDDSGTGNDTETQDITVVIAGTNDTPTVTVVDVTGAVTEDASTPNLTDSGSVNFSEIDQTDILTSSVALSNTATTGPAIPAAINTALGTAMSLTQTGTNDGSITWDFSLANNLTQYLAQGETLTATYTITIVDDSGTGTSSTTQDVTVVITGTNDTPIITVVDAIGAVSENDSVPNLTDTGSLNFTEVDDTDNLSSSVAIATTSTTGPAIPPGLASALTTAMSLNQTGTNDGTITWNFSVANSETQYLAIGETVTATYTVTVVDDSGMGNNTATQDVTVVITGTNAAPIITVVDVTGAVTEDAATPNLTDSGSINFAEAEVTDIVTSSVALTNTATTGPVIPAGLATALTSAVSLNQTGTNDGSITWNFSVANSETQYLAIGETVTATYTITLVDDSGTANDTSTQDVVVVITGTNDTPTITVVDVMGAVTEDAATPNLTDNGSITFAEADDTDVLNSSVALTNTTTTGPAIPATASTALANAMTLSQTGTNDGTVTWNFSLANNAAQYLADGETITATYTITLVDDSGLGNNTTTQNVTVVITGTNDTPSINVIDVTGNVTEDASTPNLTDNGNFTFTEIDATDLLTSSVALTNTTTNGPAIPAALSTALSTALGTTQTGNNDGAVTWNFNLANNLIQYLAEGETVTATYTVTLTDDSGTGNDTETQDITVVITGTNDTPTVTVVDVTGAVTEDASTPNLTDSGSVNFSEIDQTDILTSSVALSNTATTGPAIPAAINTALGTAMSLTQTGTNDGSITWDFSLANNLTQYLAQGETLTATYTITIVDDSGMGNNTTTQDVTVTITGTNDTPTITVVDVMGAVTENDSVPNLTDTGSVTFAEVDDTDLLNSSVALTNTATTGPVIPAGLATALTSAVSLNQTGTNDGSITWNFSVANSETQYLAIGETVTATYTITVIDDSGTGNNTATQDVTVVITGTNAAPIITVVDVTGAVTEDAATPNLTDSGSINFAEAEVTDNVTSSVALTNTATTGPAVPAALSTALGSAMGLTQTGTNSGSVDWSFSLDNSLTQYLADGETVTATYTITLVDDSGTANDTSTQDVTVVITGTNDTPTITVVDVMGAVTEDAATPNLTDNGSITFAEADDTDVLNSSVALTNTTTTGPAIPASASTALANAVTLGQTGTNDGTINWTFSIANAQTQYLADGETITATYTITLTDDSGTGTNTTTQDVTVVITGTNDTPTITVVNVMGAVTEDASTPTLTDSGSITFAEVDDTDLLTSSVALTNATANGPVMTAALTNALGTAMEITQTGNNDGVIAWNFNVSNTLVQFLAEGETVTATYTVTLTDDSGTGNDTETQDITVVITGTNDTPTVTVVDVTGAVTEDASTPNLTDSGSVNFTEIDQTDILTSSVALSNTATTGPAIPAAINTALGTAMSLTQTGTNDGSITWDFSLANNLTQYLAQGETLTATYTITIVDDSGMGNNTTTQDVTVTITGTNDTPTITVVDVMGAVTENDSVPNLTDTGSVTFAEVDDTDLLNSSVALTNTATTGPVIPAGLATALTSAVSLNQTGTNDGSITWNFSVANSETQYLAIGETVTATYTITVIDDSGAGNNTATQDVTVVITGTNAAPIITVVDVTGAVTEDAATPNLTDSGSINFAEAEATDNVTSSVALTNTATTGPAVTAALNTALSAAMGITQTGTNSGSVDWSFSLDNSLTQYLADGETVTATYTISLVDDSGTANDTSTQDVVVVITGTNDTPTITVVDVMGAVTEDAATPTLTDSGSITFAEADDTDVLNSSVALTNTTTTGPAIATTASTALANAMSLSQTGTNDGSVTWNFALANDQTQYLADGETITATYTITLTDDSGTGTNTTTQDVTVVITGTNDTPTITVVDVMAAITEDASTPTLTDSGSITFAEVDDTDLLTSSVALTNATANGPVMTAALTNALGTAMGITQTGNNDGVIAWNFNVSNTLVQFLAEGETVTATYTVSLTDDSGTGNDMATQDITVVITGTNDTPTVTVVDVTGAVTEDAATPTLTDSGSVNFTEIDQTDILTSSVALSNTATTGPAIPAAINTALGTAMSLTQTGTNDGSITWDFSLANNLTQYLAQGETLTATYTITIVDDSGMGNNTTTQDVTVTITGTNDTPIITVVDVTGAVTENDSVPNLTDTGSVTFAEVDDTDLLNSSVALTNTATTGPVIPAGLATALTSAVSLNQTGTNDGSITWNFSVANSETQYLAIGETVTATYTITVIDDSGAGNNTATQDVTVVITGTNAAPIITVVDVTGAVTEDAATPNLTDSGSINFAEAEVTDIVTSSVALTNTATTGPAVTAALNTALSAAMGITQTGTNSGSVDWSFSLDNSLTQYLADGETVTATYTITLVDDSGTANDTSTQDVVVVITGTNDTPTITVVDVMGAVTEDAATPTLTDSGSITFAEADDTDLLTSSVALTNTTTTGPAIPASASTALANAVTLGQTGTNDGTINWTFSIANAQTQYLADGETITATYTITLTDDSGTGTNTTTQDVTVVITGSNDTPTITVVDVMAAITEDASTPTLTDSGSITFAEVDDTDLLTSSVALTNATANGPVMTAALTNALGTAMGITQTGNNDGVIAWNFNISNNLVQFLAEGETVTATYTVSLTDDSGTGNDMATQDITVVITGTNDTPTVTVVDVTGAVTEDAATPNLTDSGSVNFTELDQTDILTSSVALSNTATTGPAIPAAINTALGTAMSLTQTGTNDGSITWNFNLANNLTQYLAQGETLTATYTITVVDDSGMGNNNTTQDVTVVITGTNDTPTISVVDITGAVTENDSMPNLTDTGSVTFNEIDDTDLPNAIVGLTNTATTGPAIPAGLANALNTAVSLTQTGTNDGSLTWNFSIANSETQYLAIGETVTATYTITVIDDSGTGNNTATQDITVTITGTNAAPIITVVDVAGAVTEDAATPNLTDSGSVTFAETEVTDSVTSTIALSNTATTGSAVPAALTSALGTAMSITQTGGNSGSIDWNFAIANNLTQYLADGETVTATYTLTLVDDSGTANDTSTQDVIVVITGTNDAPTIAVVDVMGAVIEDATSPNLIDLGSITFSEIDDTDVLNSTVALTNTTTTGPAIPASASTALANAVTLGQTGTNDGTINWTFNIANAQTQYLADGETITATYTITVDDGSGTGTATQDVTVVITGSNDTPTITVVDVMGAVTEGASTTNLTDNGSITFAEVDDTDLLNSSVALTNTATTGTAVPTGLATALSTAMNLTQTGTNDGSIAWDFSVANNETLYLAVGETVTATYTITVVDDSGTANNATTQDVTVVITGTNAAPIVTAVDVTGAVTEDASTPILNDGGSITFTEGEATDNVVASVTLTNTATTGPAVPAALATVLNTGMGLTQTGNNSGTVNWNFSLPNSATQYLADGETVTATYTVAFTDDSGTANDTTTQDITVVITGTNDMPTITVVDVAGAVTENALTPTLTDTGSVTFAEVDDTDLLTSSVALTNTATTGPVLPAGLTTVLNTALSLTQTGTNDGTIGWNFSIANNDIQHLAVGETITATYTITVNDGSGTGNGTTTQDVTVVITGTNDAPTISVVGPDSDAEMLTETDANLVSSGTLTATDFDTSDTVVAAVTNVTATGSTAGLLSNNAALQAMLTTTPNVIDNTQQTATFTWDFASNGETFDYLATGETLTLTYTITLTDSQGITDTHDVVISIAGANDLPVGSTIEATPLIYTENAPATQITATLAIFDIDNGDLVSARVKISQNYDPTGDSLVFADQNGITGVWEPANGELTLSGVASTADYEMALRSVRFINSSDAPNAVVRTVDFVVNDGTGDSNTESRSVTVVPINDGPTLSNNNGLTVLEGSTTSITPADLDYLDLDDQLDGVFYTVTTAPAHGQLELTTNAGVPITSFTQDDIQSGRLVYVHDGNDVVLSDQFDFTIVDGGENGVAPQAGTFAITVTPVDDIPVLTQNNLTIPEGGSITITNAQLDTIDADNPANQRVFTISGLANGQFESSLAPGVSITSFTQQQVNAGEIIFIHDGGQLSPTYSVSVSDGNSTTPPQLASVSFSGVNDAPLSTVDTYSTNEDVATTGNVLANDLDVDGDTLTAVLNTDVANGVLNLLSDGSFTYTPNLDFFGTDSFTYQAFDGTAFSAGTTVTITVNAVNDAPVSTDKTASVVSATTISFDASQGVLLDAQDVDSATLTAVLVSGPSLGDFNLNPDGSWSYTANDGAFGDVPFSYRVSDGQTLSDPYEVVISVVLGGTAPDNNNQNPEVPDPGSNEGEAPNENNNENENNDNENNTGTTDNTGGSGPNSPNSANNGAIDQENLELNADTDGNGWLAMAFEIVNGDQAVRDDGTQAYQSIGKWEFSGLTRIASTSINLKDASMLTSNFSGLGFVYEDADLQLTISEFHQKHKEIQASYQLVSGTATSLFVGVSAGAAMWSLGGSYFASMVASTLPTWAGFDLIHVVETPRNKRDNDNTSVAQIISEARPTKGEHLP